jgi:hypothetical protein
LPRYQNNANFEGNIPPLSKYNATIERSKRQGIKKKNAIVLGKFHPKYQWSANSGRFFPIHGGKIMLS